MKESRLKWRSSLKCVQPTNWNSLDILPHSRRRALRRGGSRWTTGGWCTSKILWWAPKQRSAEQAWLVGPDGVCLCVQDAYARGEVFIGSKENGYTAVPGLPPNIQGSHWQFGITIVTPERKFLFACETEASQTDWMAAFQTVLNRPMLPQEYAGEPKFHFNCSPSHTYQSDLFFFFWHLFSAVEAYFKHKPWLCRKRRINGGEGHIWSLRHQSPHRATADQPRLKQRERWDLCYPVQKPGILCSVVVLYTSHWLNCWLAACWLNTGPSNKGIIDVPQRHLFYLIIYFLNVYMSLFCR